MTWVRKRIEEYPWGELNDWHEHQPWQADRGQFHRVYTTLVITEKYLNLRPAERGLLHSLWILRTISGHNVPRDRDALRAACRLPAGRWLDKAMETLERRKWVIPRKGKLAGCRQSDGTIDVEPEEPETTPGATESYHRPTPDLPTTYPRPTTEIDGRSVVGRAKTANLPPTYHQPTPENGSASQPNPDPEPLQKREREEREEIRGSPPPGNGGRPGPPECACNQTGLVGDKPCDGCQEGRRITHRAITLYRKSDRQLPWPECVSRSASGRP